MGGKRARGTERYVALLRGVNVGGRNPLPMKALREIFQNLGCREVTTYIQSGNVLFSAGCILARRVPAMVSAKLLERYGWTVAILLRSVEELSLLADANPFLANDPASLHLMCLTHAPAMELVATLDTKRSPPDAFAMCGANVFLHLPNGSARSKLKPAYFDRALATTSTVRNWNTLRKLIELGQG